MRTFEDIKIAVAGTGYVGLSLGNPVVSEAYGDSGGYRA